MSQRNKQQNCLVDLEKGFSHQLPIIYPLRTHAIVIGSANGIFVQKRQALPEYVKKYGDTCPVVQVPKQEDHKIFVQV